MFGVHHCARILVLLLYDVILFELIFEALLAEDRLEAAIAGFGLREVELELVSPPSSDL